MTDPRSSRRGESARAFFYISEDTCRRAGSTTRCTHQRGTVAHKRVPLVSAALSPLLVTNIGVPLYDQVCIIIHPYQRRRMSGFLSFCRLNCIHSFRDPIFFEHLHLEWTSSQVPSRVYYSSGVGLRLLVRLEKS